MRCSERGPKSLLIAARCHKWQCAREHVAEGFARPWPKLGNGAVLVASALAEAAACSTKPPCRRFATEVVKILKGPTECAVACLATEVNGRTSCELDGRLPPDEQPKLFTSARHITKNPTTPPVGFGSFRRLHPGDRNVGLPHQRLPLSGFFTLSAA